MPQQVLDYAEAAALVRTEAARLARLPHAAETLSLLDAQGRVLAADLIADRDQPPFPRATRDGFAALADDWKGGVLKIAGLLRAGEAWAGEPVASGTCIEIMTGAPVPAGADCVVMVEHVHRARDTVHLLPERTIASGDNIVPTGAEARSGTLLLPAGTRLSIHGIAVAAACGYPHVSVFRKPRVAILATGDELVDVQETPLPHQIRNSNTYTLAAQVRALGGEPVRLPPVADEAEALAVAIRNAARTCDLLLLSGGVSMGKYDLVEPALAAQGGVFHFTGVRIQPGKPVVFGSLNDGALPFFGLPGNPVSTIVCFALFAAPVLAALGGDQGYGPPFAQARLRSPVRNKPGLTRFLPARLTHDIAGSPVETIAWQGSGDLAGTARANCFLVIPEDAGDLESGVTVSVLLA
jgi:molybdopterin molybdotransferase